MLMVDSPLFIVASGKTLTRVVEPDLEREIDKEITQDKGSTKI
jgi:hypothetical protein